MPAGRLIVPGWMPAENASGDRIAGARLYFYANGAPGTLKAVYTTSTLAAELANPVIADDAGGFPAIWADTADTFTVAVTDGSGAPLAAYDGVSPSIDAALASVALAESAKDSAAASASAASTSATSAAASASTASTASAAAVAAAATAEQIAGFDPALYQLRSEKAQANGYAPLNGSNKVPDTHLTTAPVSTPQQAALDALETEQKAFAVAMAIAL
ncbi:hypothetical protein [Phenylobacterium sp.]|uniref:hypothetical protein n=1 Tax=Phenylobacterium sp. TaxID=1871053 RepID=UPI002731FD90|nr:hypothetical protein [Phenylobacterium sp.]MDP1873630.1 hypothetical protein [Phenylobacterium sp.]